MGYIDPRPPSDKSSSTPSSSSSASPNRPPVDPNKRYPNPSFGLSPWGPLVPASDCRPCLYTLTFLQIFIGLSLFWADPTSLIIRKSSSPPHPPPSTTTVASASNVSRIPQLNQFSDPNNFRGPSTALPPPSGQPSLTKRQIWLRRGIRAVDIGLGSCLIFLAGLELVRLQLPYDPWAEDAAKARRAAEARIKRSIGGGTANNEKVSWWFGPKGYRAVDYKEWKRRVDESLLKSLEMRNKYGPNVKPPVPPPFGNTSGNVSSSSFKSTGNAEYAMADKILKELRRNNRIKQANILRELEKQRKLGGISDEEEYGESKLSTGHSSTGNMVDVSFPARHEARYRHYQEQGGDNKTSLQDEFRSEDESQQQQINSPADINVFAVLDAWNTLSEQTDVSFRTILHYVDPYTRARLPNPVFAKKEQQQEETKEEEEESINNNDDIDKPEIIAAEIDVEKSKSSKTDFK